MKPERTRESQSLSIVILTLCVGLVCAFLSACSPEGNSILNANREQVLVDQSGWLNDGAAISYKFKTGTYKVEMTASADGAAVEWVGTNCPGTGEAKSFSEICKIPSIGQVIIKNPTTFGLGNTSSVFVRITRLAS